MSGEFTEKNSLVLFYKGKTIFRKSVAVEGIKRRIIPGHEEIIRAVNHEDSGHSWLAARMKGKKPQVAR